MSVLGTTLKEVLGVSDVIFFFIFWFECLVKIIGLGFLFTASHSHAHSHAQSSVEIGVHHAVS